MAGNADTAEIVIGLVGPAGIDLGGPESVIASLLNEAAVDVNVIRMSELIENLKDLGVTLVREPYADRLRSYMDGGTRARERAGRGDVLALAAAVAIADTRKSAPPATQRAYLIRSFKHPDEVRTLRNIYGRGFFLVGLQASLKARMHFLTESHGLTDEAAREILKRDELEGSPLGQRVRDVFHLADAFVSADEPDANKQIERIVDIVLGHPHRTPTRAEHSMHLAFGSSLRSGDLSRQVGAVIVSPTGDILATGANDVPRSGGGLYWGEDAEPARDCERGFDSNQRERDRIIVEVMKAAAAGTEGEDQLLDVGLECLRHTGLTDITEYGRAVHAEMDALLCCARNGRSTHGATVYCTTFPCHNCAKHLVAAGISRVVFIEPYPKSRALDLHGDSIALRNGAVEPDRVVFQPFAGIGPRRFVDLFAMDFGIGPPLQRKDRRSGHVLGFDRKSAKLRNPLVPYSHVDLEQSAALQLSEATGGHGHA